VVPKMLDAGYWMLVTASAEREAGCWILAAGCWALRVRSEKQQAEFEGEYDFIAKSSNTSHCLTATEI